MDAKSAWLAEKIQSVQKENPEKTVVVVAHQDEVKGGALDGVLPTELSSSLEFRQDLNMSQTYWLYNPKRLLLVQKGKDKDSAKKEEVRKSYRALGQTACTALQAKKLLHAVFLMTDMVASSGMVGLFQNGFHLHNYENSHKKVEADDGEQKEESDEHDKRTKRVNKKIETYSIHCEKDDVMTSESTKYWNVSSISTECARFLADSRGSHGTPLWMETEIHKIVKDHASIKETRVLTAEMLQQLNMNLFYNVGKGADIPPRCVMVHYLGDPSRADEVDIALVGKGITYDTGGLNLKPTGGMEDMYGDKGGACAVIGALKGTLELLPKKNIVFTCCLAENAIGSSVFKPGDIIKGMNGLSVEIGNTDAEGRLVLCDAFTYVQREFKPKEMVDIATLTGACLIALGNDTAAVFANDDDLVDELKVASKETFEPIWHMPITDEHKNTMKGNYSDLCNIGKTRMGGSSQAAAYLLRYVEGETKWAHLDIAGTALARGGKPAPGVNQTGFGAALLLNYIMNKK